MIVFKNCCFPFLHIFLSVGSNTTPLGRVRADRVFVWPEMTRTSGNKNPEIIPPRYRKHLPKQQAIMVFIWIIYYSLVFLEIMNALALFMIKSKIA